MTTVRNLLVLLLVTFGIAHAQDTRGTIIGRVIDSSEAIIPGVEVRAINGETGTTATGKTNQSGNFAIPYLMSGVYRIEAQLSGFKRFIRGGVEVRVNDTVSIDITLTPGEVAESIDVTAETPLLETSSASTGQVVDRKRVLDMPLLGGIAFSMATLTTGAVNNGGLRYRDATRPTAVSQFNADGAETFSSEFSIDGVPNQAALRGTSNVAFLPPVAAVSEFKVQTATYDASVGHLAGASINVSTTAGTNNFHGELHEFFRNRKLDSRNFFQSRSGQELPVYTYNRFGGSASGPVYIPKVYDGRNRTFWFYTYDRNPYTEPQPRTFTVPTPEQLNGNLSGLLSLGSRYQVYDPATTAPAAGGRFSRTPFPGNIIPQSRMSPLALKIAEYWPAPNQAGTADGGNNFFNGSQRQEKSYFVHVGRFDHAFSDSHRVFIRMNYDHLNFDWHRWYYNDANAIYQAPENRGMGFDDVIVFSPTFTMNTRYGITNFNFLAKKATQGIDLAALGFSNQLVALTNPSTVALPLITMSDFSGFGQQTNNVGTQASTIHSFSSTFNKLASSHMIRFGAEFRVSLLNDNRNPTADSPAIAFGANFTRGPLDNSPAAPRGQGLSSFLLGLPTGGSMLSSAGGYAANDKYLAFFIQDDWKVSPKLSLNLGLRYEYETPVSERYNRSITTFDFGVTNPIEAEAKAQYARAPIPELPVGNFTARGGLLFAGAGGQPRSLWTAEKVLLLPRVGITYAVRPTTIVRGGYGIFYQPIGLYTSSPLQTGFNQDTPLVPTLDNGQTFIASLANPFPNGLTPPMGAAGGYSTYVGQSVDYYPSVRQHPYAQRWSLGVQQQIRQVLLDVSYVGNRGTRLSTVRNYNAIPAQWLSTSPVRDQPTINFLTAQVRNPFAGLVPNTGLNSSNTPRSQLLKPYPQFMDINGVESQGYSWYHSLQVRMEKRFSKGYTLNVAYTYSKSMEATNFLNATDPMPERVVSANDYTHRIATSGIYELPFGKGRAFGSNAHGILNAILGEWQVQGIVARQSGAPLGFGNAIFSGDIKDIPLGRGERDAARWFNVNAGFERVNSRQLASNIRTLPTRFSGIRADGEHVWDLSLLKYFTFTERVKLQFRAEAYNALNHPNFNAPNTSPSNTAFGVVNAQNGNPRQWMLALRLMF